MAFQPKQFANILETMINYMRANTDVTDYEIGSVVRSILEACALEDDEAYFQMVQLLDSFSIFTATGADLVRRVADYDVVPLQPNASLGYVTIRDELLPTSTLSIDKLAGSTTLLIEDSSGLSTSYPYDVRVGEGTLQVEDVQVSNNNTLTNTLTIAPLVNNHSAGERVSFVSGAADKTITAGLQVQSPAVGNESAVVFSTIENGTIVNGNYSSTSIKARAVLPGLAGNVGSGRITQFTSSAPFSGASVTNLASFGAGKGEELPEELRSRALGKKQAASRGTPLALKEAVRGVTDAVTKQRVSTSNVLEDFENDEVIVYIDDGTGFTPDQVQLGTTTVGTAVLAGAGTVEIDDAVDFPDAGYIVISPENSSQIELLEYDGVDRTVSPAVVSLIGSTVNAHDVGDEVVLVDVLDLSAEEGTNYYETSDLPIVRNSYRLWIDNGSGLTLQTEDVDYILKRGLGRIQLIGDGTDAGDVVVTTYTYYTGLVATCQKIINGDETDEVNFPGVYTAGIPPVVETPTIRRITIRLLITAIEGKDKDDLLPLVRTVVETYISSLGIGNDVILSEIIKRAMRVPGMYNCKVITPTSDVAVSENELPVPYDTQGDSIVTIV
jgi:uncharacterized phage protein gp47/JayE